MPRLMLPLLLSSLLLCGGCAGVKAVVARFDPAAFAHAKAEQKQTLLAKGVHPVAQQSAWYYMDRQEASLREQLAGTGAHVLRDGDRIVIELPDSVSSKAEADHKVLDSVARVMSSFRSTFASVAAPAGPPRSALIAYLQRHGVDRDRILPLPEPVSQHPLPVRFTLEPLTR